MDEYRKELYKKCKHNWQIEYVENLLSLDNDWLFGFTLNDQQPDDWDGMFTKNGSWRANMSLRILKDRLIKNKFLTN